MHTKSSSEQAVLSQMVEMMQKVHRLVIVEGSGNNELK